MHNQTLLFYLSVAIFTLGSIGVLILVGKNKSNPKRRIAALMVVNALALLPLYLNGNKNAQGGILDTAISAVLEIIKVVTGNGELSTTREMLGDVPDSLVVVSAIYTGIVHLTLSALLLGLILSLFKDFFPKIKYKLFSYGDVNVFSQLNERSLLLAKDIYVNRTKDTIVFLNTSVDETTDNEVMIEQALRINAFVFSIGLGSVKFNSNINNVHFFLLKSNEKENLKDSLELTDKYNKIDFKQNIKIHILSSQEEVETVMDATVRNNEKKLKLRLIKENRLMLYNLYENLPLFLAKKDDELEILIVGVGRKGLEAAKIATWCAQTLKNKPRIIMVDKDGSIESKFEKECPGLYCKKDLCMGSDECQIIFERFDVESGDFTEMIKKYPNIGYVICTLGDDRMNIRTAISVRSVYEEIKFEKDGKITDLPFINVLVKDQFLFDITKDLCYDYARGIYCKLLSFGSLKSTYTWENIVSPYLDALGMAFNRFYEMHFNEYKVIQAAHDEKQKIKEEIFDVADHNYERNQYSKASSTALAIHCKYKLFSCLSEHMGNKYDNEVWMNTPSVELINEIKDIIDNPTTGEVIVEELSKLEHRRWNAYMLANGWRKCTTQQTKKWYGQLRDYRNFAAKLHPCIIPWSELDNLSNWMFEQFNKKVDFKELDRIMIKHLPEILLWANEINKNKY